MTQTAQPTKRIVGIVVATILIVACGLVIAFNRLNAQEIRNLQQKAEEQGVDYELIIHNEILNTYSFLPQEN
ncbi:hypothetical protein [Corynebacterium camporealensis]|uniref:hypothetical protein n=1 Tax=Corynebacterium camporealensis TaxID=161896 RepID=UPI00052CC7C9|nr:hypothetical protein [Corynebacterium camporealensis]MDY5840328.1 hypothetical protein [Corynebacterium camporealensis]